MGLLDDAIREHLDLKRRHGADPEEIERAEQEALGPVRRIPTGAAADELDQQADAPSAFEGDYGDDDGVYEQEPEGGVGYEPEVEEAPAYGDHGEAPWLADDSQSEDLAWADAADAPPPAPLPPAAEHLAPEPLPPEGTIPEPVPAPDPDSSSRLEPEPETVVDRETVEYDVEAALQDEPGEEGNNVLEETPEFLQDAPDHDRLWFEQRPPRDFDFDD